MSWRWLSALALALVLCFGCGRNADELAKLQSMQGKVERDVAQQLGQWQAAALGVGFRIGDGVRTAAGASAKLELSDGSGVALREKSVLRFLAAPPGKKAQGLRLQSGELELLVGSEELRIETPSGPALLAPGSRVRLKNDEHSTRFAVEIGAARLLESDRELKAGDAIEIGIGRAVIEPAPSASAAPSAAPSASASAAVADTRPRGPERPDLLVGAGDSLILHDPHPPAVLGFRSERCGGLTVLEVGAKRRETVGTRLVTAAFAPGSQRYRLRCDQEPKPFAEGSVVVLQDSGGRRLAVAPTNRIDADGRRYTIQYQSQLPKVSVRWPNGPSGSATLFLSSSGRGARQFTSPAPAQQAYSLPSGSLTEGSHELWFEGQGQRSRKTTVVVQFDNAAPTASISSPPERGFSPGATVAVIGMALPGWSVAVGSQELKQDAQQRFSAEITAPVDVAALGIRFSHPERGVHYYLRRSR